MVKKGLIVPPGGGSILSMAPGRSAALKLLGRETGDSIMLFEETAPAGTETTFHLHRDSDEVAYVAKSPLRSATTLRSGGRAPVPSYHAVYRTPGKIPVPKPAACCFSIPRPVPAAFSRNSWRGRPGPPMDRRPTRCGAGMAGRSSVRRLFDIRFSQKLSGDATVCER
jgi:hypothetical protein